MMKNTMKILGILLFVFLGIVYLYFFTSYVFPWEKEVAIQATLDWGGLAKLPDSAQNLKISKEGSMFTRTFIIEFTTNKKEIENWIFNSKRLKNNSPNIEGKTKIYEVYPGEVNSFGGKVKIDGNNVSIKMSWS